MLGDEFSPTGSKIAATITVDASFQARKRLCVAPSGQIRRV